MSSAFSKLVPVILQSRNTLSSTLERVKVASLRSQRLKRHLPMFTLAKLVILPSL